MYEKAMDLLLSRDADIQFDKQTLGMLMSSGVSIPETWEQLIHLKNGSIRFNACQEFLEHQLGPGRLEQSGDVRIVYFCNGTFITFPGIQAPEPCITVSISAIYRIIEKPSSSLPISNREKFLEEYLSLLQRPDTIPDRIRLRFSSDKQDWGNLMCWLYYIFVVHPRDWIKGRCTKEYWMNELEEEKSLRMAEDLSKKESWANQRLAADTFKKYIYQQLLPFEMPVMFQVPRQKAMPIERLFASAGC